MKRQRWIHWLKLAATTVVVVLLVKAFLVTSCIIPSSGMENSLYQGEGVLVNKWSYGLRLPFPSWIGYHRLASSPVQRGDIVVFNNPGKTQNPISLEYRDVFISRCIGTAGDTLMLNRELINTGNEVCSPDSKALYAYPARQEDTVLALMKAVNITGNQLVGYTGDESYVRSFSHYEYYLLTQKAEGSVSFVPLSKILEETHPYVVPQKGIPVKVYPWNAVLLCNTILQHEHRRADVKGDTLLIDGKAVDAYMFSKNYYWMASNNPVNLCDSRLFGFVPEDHIIGKASRIWWTTRKGRIFQQVQ